MALGASKSPVAEAALVNLASEPAGPVRDAALSALIKRAAGRSRRSSRSALSLALLSTRACATRWGEARP